MATITIPTFQGEIPKRTPRLLEDTQATIAINCNLERGQLEPMAGPGYEADLAMSCRTIFRHCQDGWLSWEKRVSVAKSVTYDALGDEPLGQLFITGDRPYPTQYLAGGHVCRLGLPRPVTAPCVELARKAKIATAKVFAFGTNAAIFNPARYGQTHFLNEIGSAGRKAGRCAGLGWDDADAMHPCQISALAFIERPKDNEITNCGLERSSSYCYTWLRSLAGGQIVQESAPSPASRLVDVPDGHGVKISGLALPEAEDCQITGFRLYRTVAGRQGAEFRLVTELGVSDRAHIDTVIDREISGEILQTAAWDPIPDDAAGLIATNNGVYAAFRGNELLLSEPYLPYVFPAAYRVLTEDRIVALGCVGDDLVVLTEARPWLVSFGGEGQISARQLQFEQGCVAAASLAQIEDGLYYASPDGLAYIGSDGREVITRQLFTRSQWQRLGPANILGAAVNGKYLGFFAGTNHGFVLDRDVSGVVRVELPDKMRVLALRQHSVDDCVYMSIDAGSDAEPDKRHAVFEWGAGKKLPYVWRSKPFFSSRLVSMRNVRVEWQPAPRMHAHVNVYGPDPRRPRQKIRLDDTRTKRIQSMRAEKLWSLELVGLATVYEARLGTGVEDLEYGG